MKPRIVLGLNREEAADAVGVSPNVFDRMVTAGELPKPHRSKVSTRLIWHVDEISAAMRALPVDEARADSPYAGVRI